MVEGLICFRVDISESFKTCGGANAIVGFLLGGGFSGGGLNSNYAGDFPSSCEIAVESLIYFTAILAAKNNGETFFSA